jgi:hypothetical protein
VLRARNENTPTSITERVAAARGATRTIVDKPTGTQREQDTIVRRELDEVSAALRQRAEKDVKGWRSCGTRPARRGRRSGGRAARERPLIRGRRRCFPWPRPRVGAIIRTPPDPSH